MTDETRKYKLRYRKWTSSGLRSQKRKMELFSIEIEATPREHEQVAQTHWDELMAQPGNASRVRFEDLIEILPWQPTE